MKFLAGITPVIPGVNIPWAHLPMFMFVLIVAGTIHEVSRGIVLLGVVGCKHGCSQDFGLGGGKLEGRRKLGFKSLLGVFDKKF